MAAPRTIAASEPHSEDEEPLSNNAGRGQRAKRTGRDEGISEGNVLAGRRTRKMSSKKAETGEYIIVHH